MELPNAKLRQEYIDSVKALETEIKRIASTGDVYDVALQSVQEQLDILAKKYQKNEKLGSSRYKLYELQAFIYYFGHRDEDALDFIEQAVQIRGSTYAEAEKLRDDIAGSAATATAEVIPEANMTKAEKRQRLIGAEGWLALFIVGLFISTALTMFNFFNGGVGMSSSDIQSLNDYQTGLGDSTQGLVAIENIGLVVYISLLIASIVLILRRRKVAKVVTIIMLIYSVLYNLIDYSVAYSLFSSTALLQYIQPELDKNAGYIGRGIIAAIVWIPYFLVSKRVKATLTK